MKNPKILPFGDWFKVYEKAGSNFNKTQRLLESRIFEAAGATLPEPGRDLKSNAFNALDGTKFEKKRSAAYTWLGQNRRVGYVQTALDEVKKILDIDDRIYSRAFAGSTTYELNVLANFIAAYSTKNDMKVKKVCEDKLKNFSIDRDSEEDIKLTPSNDGTLVKTTGRVRNGNATIIDEEGKSSQSSYLKLKNYINQFNFIQYAGGGNDEYDKDSIENGYFNLESAPASVGSYIPLFVGGTYEGGTAQREESTTETREGASPAVSSQIDIPFENGSSEIPKGFDSTIETLAKQIMEQYGKDQTVDTFNLISSASPVWDGGETMADYEGKPVNGTGDPGEGTDFATKNYKLAYDRGVSLMDALNIKLNELGHPGFANFVVNWQVSDKGGKDNNGRYVDLQLGKNEQKGTVKKTTSISGKELTAATTTSGSKESTLFYYGVSF